MHEGIYIVAADSCQDAVWKRIIESLSQRSSNWIVDCLDCLYDTALINSTFCSDKLLSVLEGNKYIFSARMIGVDKYQQLDKEIITSKDYLNSNCHSIVLCADSVYFEVFSKCENKLLDLMRSLPKDSIASAIWIDDSFGGRLEFIV